MENGAFKQGEIAVAVEVVLLFDIKGDELREKRDKVVSIVLLYTLYQNFPMLFNSKENQPKGNRHG